jgi:esterase/lipase superfamily enzyme
MYSWPSGGAVSTYGWDRESAEGARDYLRVFLDMVIKDTGAKSISLIAHSMGNIALLDALRDMSVAKPPGVVISQIIFAAPDVSVDDFARITKSIKGLASGATLYASSNDRALQISRGIWRSYRAGDVPPTGPMLADGVDTIDVTGASTDVFNLNHSGYAKNNDLLKDMGALIEKGIRPPQARSQKIRAVQSTKGEYWLYVP